MESIYLISSFRVNQTRNICKFIIEDFSYSQEIPKAQSIW